MWYLFTTLLAIVTASSCSKQTDCFNCTMVGDCLWKGDKCTSDSITNTNNLNDDNYTVVKTVKGDDDDDKTKQYAALKYGDGNTYSVFESAKQCGDPLNLCLNSNPSNLSESGDSTVMSFSGKSIPNNYFCLFTFNDSYMADTFLMVTPNIPNNDTNQLMLGTKY